MAPIFSRLFCGLGGFNDAVVTSLVIHSLHVDAYLQKVSKLNPEVLAVLRSFTPVTFLYKVAHSGMHRPDLACEEDVSVNLQSSLLTAVADLIIIIHTFCADNSVTFRKIAGANCGLQQQNNKVTQYCLITGVTAVRYTTMQLVILAMHLRIS